jgi:processive 1,2-diacylglycerol beta-glucosyltransferase
MKTNFSVKIKKMNKKLLVVWCICLSLLAEQVSHAASGQANKRHDQSAHLSKKNGKKLVTIFSCLGGGGHVSAAKAIEKYLEPFYDVQIINLIGEILVPLDPVRKLTFNRYTSEDAYNYGLKNGWISVLNTMIPLGNRTANFQQKTIEHLIAKYLKKAERKPDVLISVIPVFNGSIIDYAKHKKNQLPVIITTADLDGINYVNGIAKPSYDLLCYCIPYEDKEIRKRIKSARLRHSHIKVTGFPIRPDFFENKDVSALKKFYKVPTNKPVIMIMMGAAGSNSTYSYLTALLGTNLSMHIIACLGRNQELRTKIDQLSLPPTITLTTLGFTDRISDIMAISDVLITKPGPTTMAEALQMNLPMILDGTKRSLYWEVMNFNFIKKNRFGHVLTSYGHLEKVLSKYILTHQRAASIRRRMKNFDKGCFAVQIRALVKDLLKKSESKKRLAVAAA